MIHVLPQSDSKPHIQSSTCECNPEYDPEFEMIVHNAFTDTGQKWLALDHDDTFNLRAGMKKRYQQPEETLHIAVSSYIMMQYPDVIFTAESSGVKVSKAIAGKMKARRSKGNHLDMIISEPRGAYHGLFIELKAEGKSPFLKDGSLSIDKHVQGQEKMRLRLIKKGYYARFATGFDEAKSIIDLYMKGDKNY